MGRIVTPTYRVEVFFTNGTFTSAAWHTRSPYGRADGRPTEANLKRYCDALEQSSLPGGCNAHCGEIRISSANIIRQDTGRVVASYTKAERCALELNFRR
jgi:hypothetical protein